MSIVAIISRKALPCRVASFLVYSDLDRVGRTLVSVALDFDLVLEFLPLPAAPPLFLRSLQGQSLP